MNTVAMLGCGGIARDGYLPALIHLRPNRVVLWDPDKNAMAKSAQILNAAGVHVIAAGSLQDVLLADCAVLAVPPLALPALVRDMASAVAQQRCQPMPILVEKPLGVDIAAADNMHKTTKDVLELSYMETFLHSTAYDVMLDELRSGRLGRVSGISVGVRGSLPAELERQWRGDRATGGGVLHDWGIHSFGLVLHFLEAIELRNTSPTVQVQAANWQVFGARKVLTECVMNLNDLPCPVKITVSWHGPSTSESSPDVLVECERGSIGLLVRKTAGSSDWVCIEHRDGRVHELASRRYPKELFVRGLAGFIKLQGQSRDVASKYQFTLGRMAIGIADAAYSQVDVR